MHARIERVARRGAVALAIAGLLVGAGTTSAADVPSGSWTPGALRQQPGVYEMTVSQVRVVALSDGTVPQDLHMLLRDATKSRIDTALEREFIVDPMEVSINAFLLDTGSRRTLIDAGAGNLFGPGNAGRLLDALAAAKVDPESIDDILITHIHTDHSGGLTRDGQRVFTRATVHVGQPDLDFFLDPVNAAKADYDPLFFEQAITTLEPYLKADKVRGFDGTTEISPGVTGSVHPGHTPGSAFYTLESDGREIVFVGDIVHAGAVQFPHPSVTIVYDVDRNRAAKTRRDAFETFTTDRVLVAAPHLSFPGIGHVRKAGEGYAWVPVDYVDRAE